MEDLIKIGIIVKPQGIKGEVKVFPLTDDISRFKLLNEVIISGQNFKVNCAKIAGNMVILSLSGIFDRNVAEEFRNKEIFVKRKDAVRLPENSFFIDDVLGCDFFDDEENYYGKVVDVMQAKTDVWTVSGARGIIRFPFLKDLEPRVDLFARKIVVKAKRFKEVFCYED